MKVLNKSAGTCKYCSNKEGLLLQDGNIYLCIYCDKKQNLFKNAVDYVLNCYPACNVYKCISLEHQGMINYLLENNEFYKIKEIISQYMDNRRIGYCYCGALMDTSYKCLYHGRID